MNADGWNVAQVTADPAANFWPTWSPDGTQLAFSSDRGGGDDEFVIGADGSGERNLTARPGDQFHPSWNPDGSVIAYVDDADGPELRARRCSPPGHSATTTRQPGRPDGKSIAFTRYKPDGESAIFVMRSDGSSAFSLTHSDDASRAPAWQRPRTTQRRALG